MKEKNQESNLIDFKLREMARNNDMDAGFLKPHSGINQGILSSYAGAALIPTINLTNKSIYKSIEIPPRLRGESKQSRRSFSRYSVASRVSHYEDGTISTRNKRQGGNLPKIGVDRLDTNYMNILTDNLKQTPAKKSNVSRSVVNNNTNNNQARMPSHLRGSSVYSRNQQQFKSDFKLKTKKSKAGRFDIVNKSMNIGTISERQSLGKKDNFDVFSTPTQSIDRKYVGVSLNRKLKSNFKTVARTDRDNNSLGRREF